MFVAHYRTRFPSGEALSFVCRHHDAWLPVVDAASFASRGDLTSEQLAMVEAFGKRHRRCTIWADCYPIEDLASCAAKTLAADDAAQGAGGISS